MKKVIIILAIVVISSTAQAQVYRCNIDGKTVFTNRPCNGGNSQEQVFIKNQNRPIFSTDSHTRNSKDTAEDTRHQITKLQIQSIDIEAKIKRLDLKVRAAEGSRGSRLNALRYKKRKAANNLAGAVWEKSISDEMQAVVSMYNNQINSLLPELERNKSELREIDAKIKRLKQNFK